MHVTGESFAIRVSHAIEPKRKGRANVRSGSVRLLSRRSNVRNVNLLSSCVLGDGVVLSLCCRSYNRTCGKHLLRRLCTVLLCTVAPRIRVTGGSFAIRVSFSIKLGGSGIPLPPNQTEAEEWMKECSLPICLPSLRKIRDCSIFHFFFNFFGDQVASWWSPTRKVSRQWRVGDR